MITRKEIIEMIRENLDTCKEGIREIAKDAGHEGPLNTIDQLANYCDMDENALEFVLA